MWAWTSGSGGRPKIPVELLLSGSKNLLAVSLLIELREAAQVFLR